MPAQRGRNLLRHQQGQPTSIEQRGVESLSRSAGMPRRPSPDDNQVGTGRVVLDDLGGFASYLPPGPGASTLPPRLEDPLQFGGLASGFSIDFTPYLPKGEVPRQQDPGYIVNITLQGDLGLKLEPRKSPVEVLVIDSVNKVPSGN